MTDEELEDKIALALLELQAAETDAARRAAWERMKRFIGRRSPEQVTRMERALRYWW